VNKSKWPRFLLVLIPYITLIGVTIYSYIHREGDLKHDIPKIVLFIPAFVAIMLPATYAVLLFGVKENTRPKLTVMLGIFMGLTLLGLAAVVYLLAEA
jgi:hypothetical protein